MGLSSQLADPGIWYRPATKANGTEYYEYILVYVDDQLTISDNPKKAITDKLLKVTVVWQLNQRYQKCRTPRQPESATS